MKTNLAMTAFNLGMAAWEASKGNAWWSAFFGLMAGVMLGMLSADLALNRAFKRWSGQ